MQPKLDYGLMRCALRAQICEQCAYRKPDLPPTAESPSAITPLSCEASCSLFRSLPRLAHFVIACHGQQPYGNNVALQNMLAAAKQSGEPGGGLGKHVQRASEVVELVISLTDRRWDRSVHHGIHRRGRNRNRPNRATTGGGPQLRIDSHKAADGLKATPTGWLPSPK